MQTVSATNANAGKFARVGLTPNECEFARARQRGWNDWRNGKPFRVSYDKWKKRKQWAYERGRLQAARASVHGKLTRWHDDEILFPTVLFRSMSMDDAWAVHTEMKAARKRNRKQKES